MAEKRRNCPMKTSEFWYDLPQELIAQCPIEPRDHSRLMAVDRQSGQVAHRHFYDIVEYLEPGDALVINDTRVMPARLLASARGAVPARCCCCGSWVPSGGRPW